LRVNLTHWIEQHPLVVFFVLAYVISWVILAPLAILGESAASVSLLLVVTSAFGPALAVLVVTRVTEGRESEAGLDASEGCAQLGDIYHDKMALEPHAHSGPGALR
jgi:hypothetical protein